MTVSLRVLAVSVALLGSLDDVIAGHERDHSQPAPVEGEIVLTNTPFCGFFAVDTNQGFSLLRWRGEMEVFA